MMNKVAKIFLAFLLFLAFPPRAEAAFFSLEPASASFYVDEEKDVMVRLDTEDQQADALDLVFHYDSALISIEKVDFNNLYTLQDSKIDNDKGVLRLFATMDSSDQYYQGADRLATIRLKAVGSGQAGLDFVCQAGDTDDTNIWHEGGDMVNCGLLQNADFDLSVKPCVLPDDPQGIDAISGPGQNEVTLSWLATPGTDYYRLSYGPSSRHYLYGALNIGNGTSYTVKNLSTGKPYYFLLLAVNSCGVTNANYEVMAYAGRQVTSTVTPEPPATVIDKEEIADLLSLTPTSSPTPVVIPSPEPTAVVATTGNPVSKSWPFWLILGPGLLLVVYAAARLFSTRKPKNPKSLDSKTSFD